MVKFIHTADLHLGSPFIGLTKRQAPLAQKAMQASFEAFERIVDLSIEEQIDFLCIVGDIYDSTRQHIKEQLFLKKQCERLKKEQIPVYILHGNHDFITSKDISLPENVFVFASDVETTELIARDGKRVAISGFSYATRWIPGSQVGAFPPKSRTADFHIGMYHGELAKEGVKQEGYAPFQLRQMAEKQYDYWALGHVHTPMILQNDPLIAYSGNLQGRSFKEQGKRGAYLIELEKGKAPLLTQLDIASIEWKEWSIIWQQEDTFETCVFHLRQQLLQEQWKDCTYYTRIIIFSEKELSRSIQQAFQEECERQLQQFHKNLWVIEVKVQQSTDFQQKFSSLSFDSNQQASKKRMDWIANTAFEHRVVYQLFKEEMESEEWLKEVKEEAVQLLQHYWKEETDEN